MAKRAAQAMADQSAPAAVTVESLDRKLRAEFEALKRPVSDLANRFAIVRESVKRDIGPRVMRFFASINATATISFVDFARLFDPSMPTHAAERNGVPGYRESKIYYTLDYMRRQTTQRPRGRQGVRDTATDALARAIATLVANLPEDQHGRVWESVQREFQYNERIMGRLQKRVEATKPLFTLEVPRAGVVKVGKVIHMASMKTSPAPENGEQAGDLAAPGRRVRRTEAA